MSQPMRFSASNAARFMTCHASANLPEAIPGWQEPVVDRTAGAKGKGSMIHGILEQTASLSAKDLRHLARALEFMAELRSRRRFKVLTEYTFTATWLQSKPQTTVDVALYVQDELHIVDYKTGTIFVDVNDNEQLLFYAACAIELAPKAKGVWIHIVQPWANNIASVFIPLADLASFMKRACEAEEKILRGDVSFGPSDHCKFCPAYPHSRSEKGRPLCPVTLRLLYPPHVDEAAILQP